MTRSNKANQTAIGKGLSFIADAEPDPTIFSGVLEDVKMAVEKTGGSEMTRVLADTVSSVTQFALTAIVKGKNPDYSARIESDLVEQLPIKLKSL